jgi:hypothetical protein
MRVSRLRFQTEERMTASSDEQISLELSLPKYLVVFQSPISYRSAEACNDLGLICAYHQKEPTKVTGLFLQMIHDTTYTLYRHSFVL